MLWLTDRIAQRYSQRPSALLGIDPEDAPLAAYNLDSACFYFGNWVENKLQETVETGSGKKKRSKAKYTLGELLDPEGLKLAGIRVKKYAAFVAPSVAIAGTAESSEEGEGDG